MTSTREILEAFDWRCVYCSGRATEKEHVIPKAMTRRHRIERNSLWNLVASCSDCNSRKACYRLYPKGFDTSLLPGKLSDWKEWSGQPISEMYPK